MKRAKAHGSGAANAPRRCGPALCKSEGGCGVVVRVHARRGSIAASTHRRLRCKRRATPSFCGLRPGSVLHNSLERKPKPAFLCVCA